MSFVVRISRRFPLLFLSSTRAVLVLNAATQYTRFTQRTQMPEAAPPPSLICCMNLYTGCMGGHIYHATQGTTFFYL
jgi:hypothetical protein